MINFNAKMLTKECIKWIQDWFDKNGKGCKAVIGISGGLDSSVVAALCVKALGKKRVVGVLMPNHIQNDIGAAYLLVDHLGIMYTVQNIGAAVDEIIAHIKIHKLTTFDHTDAEPIKLSEQTEINLPSRIRMATLYAISQSVNGRVANTCNLSEDWVGYSTRYGDSVGDFSPLSKFTKTEVKEIAKVLGLPSELIEKVPSDGLCGKTDEENLGFTYAELDEYIRTGRIENINHKQLIDKLHEKNQFKLKLMEVFSPDI